MSQVDSPRRYMGLIWTESSPGTEWRAHIPHPTKPGRVFDICTLMKETDPVFDPGWYYNVQARLYNAEPDGRYELGDFETYPTLEAAQHGLTKLLTLDFEEELRYIHMILNKEPHCDET